MTRDGEYYEVTSVYDDESMHTYYYATHFYPNKAAVVVSRPCYYYEEAADLVRDLNKELFGKGYLHNEHAD